MTFNCSTVPETTNTDAGVAGAGVRLDFEPIRATYKGPHTDPKPHRRFYPL
jgi:hypothetical protein